MVIKRTFACLAFATALAAAQPAAAQLANRTAEEWMATLDTKTRIEGLKIADTLGKLGLKPGMVVADIGAGTGVFTIPFAQNVRPGGKVFAVEVDEKLLEHIQEVATEQGINTVQSIFAEYDDPGLPAPVDLAFIHDVLHHIEHREVYLKNLAGYLKPTGKIAIIDFRPGQGGHRDDPKLQVTQEQVTAWLAASGLKPLEEIKDLFTDKWFVIYGK